MRATRTLWIWLTVATAACRTVPAVLPPTDSPIVADVAYLASPELGGRATGSAGGDRAALFLVDRHMRLGLTGGFPASCSTPASCEPGFVQRFEARGVRAENIIAAIPGADPLLRTRYVILGGHYDHLGFVPPNPSNPELVPGLRRGADDNASGTAALLELARRFSTNPPPFSVLVAHFDAEEVGLIGSRELVESSPVPLDSIALMINLDMIGRLGPRSLTVEVTEPADHYRDLIVQLAQQDELVLRFSRVTAGRSDHSSFAAEGVPAIAFFTGFHSDYHLPGDTPEKLDYEGILRIVDLAERLVRAGSPTANP